MDRTELAWAAGFWDGEGSTWLTRPEGRGTAQPQARINQSSATGVPEVLSRFRSAAGIGEIRGPELKKGREPLYRWVVSSRRDVQQLRALLDPWLGGVKRSQFADVLGARATVPRWENVSVDERRAWAAGLWDGEGSVCLLKHRSHPGYFVPEASITQASADGRPEVLERAAALAAGGYWYGPFSQEGSKLPVYRWKLFRHDEIRTFLDLLWPWLGLVKRRQAERVLEVLASQAPLPRGNPAWGAYKTHCVNGHEYATARVRPYRARTNGGVERRASKQCLACVREQARGRRRRRKQRGDDSEPSRL
jgi:hypothetical protein